MLTVGDVMTASVVTVRDSAPLRHAAELLIERGISGVPVVDDAGSVVGVISEADFLFKESGPEVAQHRRLGRFFGASKATESHRRKLAATTAGEAMTSPAITVRPAQTIAEAARLMTGKQVNRLVVTDGGTLAGIVTRADLVRAFVRSDEELARIIREEVLLRIMWLDPAAFDVRVVNGVATITGHAERCSTAEMMESTIAMVPGIVAVQADITWSLDDRQVRPAPASAFFLYGPS